MRSVTLTGEKYSKCLLILPTFRFVRRCAKLLYDSLTGVSSSPKRYKTGKKINPSLGVKLHSFTHQTLSIDTISVRFIMVASSTKRKMSLLPINKVKPVPNKIVLACNTTTSIRILNARSNLHTDAGEATYLLLISFA